MPLPLAYANPQTRRPVPWIRGIPALLLGGIGACLALQSAFHRADTYLRECFDPCGTARPGAAFCLEFIPPLYFPLPILAAWWSTHLGTCQIPCRALLWASLAAWGGACVGLLVMLPAWLRYTS